LQQVPTPEFLEIRSALVIADDQLAVNNAIGIRASVGATSGNCSRFAT